MTTQVKLTIIFLAVILVPALVKGVFKSGPITIFNTPTPSPTPTVIISPIEEPRLAYVQRKLIDQGFSEAQVNPIITDPRRTIFPAPTVVSRPANWEPIKQKLYSSNYVSQGKNYIKTHQAILDKAEAEFGVLAEIIVGIIAIETEFGRNTGKTPTFNAIYSRLMHTPASKSWALEAERLAALSKYCIEGNLDCYNIKGSYAGAIGLVQFMPDSLQNFGIDGDGNGFIDLNNPVDAIPSAANFLKKHGWDDDQTKALTRYYGNPVGYPEIALHYADLLK